MAASLSYPSSFLICFVASIFFILLASVREHVPYFRSVESFQSQSQLEIVKASSLNDNGILINSYSHGFQEDIHRSHELHSPFTRREDYTCDAGRKCGNDACCGASGHCGYGPTYCGDGCTSNCNATAPCGKYHKVPGTTCPLNTCCSEWGFCGTTDEFCNAKCQSNCELHPKPMASGGQVLDKVIGYYESWSARLSCHKMGPTDLPLDALTHLNYAFAYIDPKTLALTTMDSQTPESLFREVADVKKYSSKLEVWISVGGWTFSDNGTVTQPLFGDIARSPGKRREFVNNVLKFLNQYGYDGIDIDWEYPGAPDRGGKDDDTKNYVELLKQLRATFDASGRKLGITFTAPSSLWYLRWFDLPGMLKYSDWINVMTYDLHGTWDSTNPIGNIVQGHTNLTEIGWSLELFWRVNIPPEKVFMGFGFYGRSFQLQDASCSTPGCRFKGGAAAGPCSDTSGILMYYEIMSLLKQNPDLKPVYDKDAGVKYVVYSKDQWVSYDDAQTMKQKRDWANKIGVGGSLIWASDADDDKYTAHTGLLGGKTLKHVDVKAMENKQLAEDSLAVTQSLIGQNGQDCEVVEECKKDDGSEGTCGSKPGTVSRGWEKGKCGKGKQRPICCPSKTAPKANGCRWRGHVSDCNGQCHPGETMVFKSSWGGSSAEKDGDTRKCGRGVKAFCCDAGDWKTITDQCYWTKCGTQCPINLQEVVARDQKGDWGCLSGDTKARYCCKRPAVLKECTWRTGAAFDCANAKCNKDEVEVDSHPSGSGKFACQWGRKQVACCKAEAPPPSKSLTCAANLCLIDPSACEDSSVEDSLARRDVTIVKDTLDYGDDLEEYNLNEYDLVTLEKRSRGFINFKFGNNLPFPRYRRQMVWPEAGRLFRTAFLRRVVRPILFQMRARNCPDVTVTTSPINVNAPLPIAVITLPNGRSRSVADTEHVIDRQVLALIIEWLSLGFMRNPDTGETQGLPRGAIGESILQRILFADSLPAGIGGIGNDNTDLREPIRRMMRHLGDEVNPQNLLAVQTQINLMKGQIIGFKAPIEETRFTRLARSAASGLDQESQDVIMTNFRNLVGVFIYLQDPTVASARRAVAQGISEEFSRAENLDVGMYGAASSFRAILYRHNRWVEDFAQNWLADHITAFESEIILHRPSNAAQLLKDLKELKAKVKDMTIPDYF